MTFVKDAADGPIFVLDLLTVIMTTYLKTTVVKRKQWKEVLIGERALV